MGNEVSSTGRGVLAGRVALVTGSGKGFGKAIAKKYLEHGASVVLHYNKSERGVRELLDLAENLGVDATAVQGDLSVANAGAALVGNAVQKYGEINILVNNAGVMSLGAFVESGEQAWAADIEVNVFAPLRVTRAALPIMIAQGGGKIVNISSQLAQRPWDRGAVYAGTKGFILSWSKSLAAEVGRYNITVNAVGPGSIVTDMNKDIFPDIASQRKTAQQLPLRRLGAPADVAEVALFLASPGSDFMTGQMLGINGGSQM